MFLNIKNNIKQKKNCTSKSFFVLEINLLLLMMSLTNKARNRHILPYIKGYLWNIINYI